MIIRRAVEGDAAAIAHVHRSSRAEAYGDPGLGRSVRPVVVAENDEVVVGFAAIDGDALSALYVLPGAQGSGIGRELLLSAMKEGAHSLWVYSANAGARRFYERHGWSVVEGSEMTGEHWNPRAPAVQYRVHALSSL